MKNMLQPPIVVYICAKYVLNKLNSIPEREEKKIVPVDECDASLLYYLENVQS